MLLPHPINYTYIASTWWVNVLCYGTAQGFVNEVSTPKELSVKMDHNGDVYSGLIWASRGKLNISKLHWYLVVWKYVWLHWELVGQYKYNFRIRLCDKYSGVKKNLLRPWHVVPTPWGPPQSWWSILHPRKSLTGTQKIYCHKPVPFGPLP